MGVTSSRTAVIGDDRAGKHSIPRAQNEKELLTAAQAGRMGPEDVEALQFQFAQEAPVNRTHQLRGRHGTPIGFRQRLARLLIEGAGLPRYVGSERIKALGVFELEDLLFPDSKLGQLRQGKVNAAASSIASNIP